MTQLFRFTKTSGMPHEMLGFVSKNELQQHLEKQLDDGNVDDISFALTLLASRDNCSGMLAAFGLMLGVETFTEVIEAMVNSIPSLEDRINISAAIIKDIEKCV